MQLLKINAAGGKIVELNFPDGLQDITLGQWQVFEELKSRDSDNDDYEHGMTRLKDDDLLFAEAELELLKASAKSAKLKAITPPTEHPNIDKVPIPYLETLLTAAMLNEVGDKPILSFEFQAGLRHDWDTFNQSITKTPWHKRKSFKPARKSLLGGKFIVVPLVEVELRAKMSLDLIQRTGIDSVIMDGDLKKTMEREGFDLQQLLNHITQMQEDTIEGKRIKNRQLQLLAQYTRELEVADYRNLHKFISHLVVPEAYPKYDDKMAEKRADLFKQLPMDVVMGIRNFFFHARRVSELLTQHSSSSLTTPR